METTPPAHTVAVAAKREKREGRPFYVVQDHLKLWIITDRMPLLGVWYSSDGIRHG